MIDFSKISQASLLGMAIRLPLRIIPRQWAVPVIQGPLRGMRWTVGSGIHGCWLGTFESDKARQLAQELRPGMVVFDIGAHAGYYTLLAAPRVGENGRVVAFEPNPNNVYYLKRHININKLGNVTVYEGAVSDRSAEMRFDPSHDSSMGRLSALGPMTVKTVSLDDWIAKAITSPPSLLKIDVEGAEKAVLEGATNLLRTTRPVIFLATHSPELRVACAGLLTGAGYRIHLVAGDPDEIIARPISA
jgi:FkbM family methyltransferase